MRQIFKYICVITLLAQSLLVLVLPHRYLPEIVISSCCQPAEAKPAKDKSAEDKDVKPKRYPKTAKEKPAKQKPRQKNQQK